MNGHAIGNWCINLKHQNISIFNKTVMELSELKMSFMVQSEYISWICLFIMLTDNLWNYQFVVGNLSHSPDCSGNKCSTSTQWYDDRHHMPQYIQYWYAFDTMLYNHDSHSLTGTQNIIVGLRTKIWTIFGWIFSFEISTHSYTDFINKIKQVQHRCTPAAIENYKKWKENV